MARQRQRASSLPRWFLARNLRTGEEQASRPTRSAWDPRLDEAVPASEKLGGWTIIQVFNESESSTLTALEEAGLLNRVQALLNSIRDSALAGSAPALTD